MNAIYGVEQLGPMLARLRQTRGYTQATLAARLCSISGHPTITRHEVSRWERHERLPSEFWLQWLAEALGVPLSMLRLAAAATRQRRTTTGGLATEPGLSPYPVYEPAGYPPVTGWLTLHLGPKQTVIALGGLEVDQLRTVLSPITPTEPALGNDTPATKEG